MKPPPAILANRFDNDDWHVISLYHEILQPIKKATADIQGHAGGRTGCIWQVYRIFEDLLAHFERLRQQYPVNEALLQQSKRQKQNERNRQSELTFDASNSTTADHVIAVLDDQTTFEHHLSTNINAGWQKLNAYYEKLDDSPIYSTSIVLHPRMKWRWIEKRWSDRHGQTGKIG
ncbi:hypothetical protein LTR49_026560 [Elasticomyces elasticus]|nr:hypothetical protein LTR49_026560 [Elasticomyces elasticus]